MTQIPFLICYFTQLSLNWVPVFPLLCLHLSQSLVLALYKDSYQFAVLLLYGSRVTFYLENTSWFCLVWADNCLPVPVDTLITVN